MSDDNTPPRKTYALKAKEFERVNAPLDPAQPTPLENDVYAIRHDLREREQSAGMDELAPGEPRKSRRRRDYWLCMVGLNLVMIALIVGSRFNLVVTAYAGAGMVVLTLGLTWTMWFVMDDY